MKIIVEISDEIEDFSLKYTKGQISEIKINLKEYSSDAVVAKLQEIQSVIPWDLKYPKRLYPMLYKCVVEQRFEDEIRAPPGNPYTSGIFSPSKSERPKLRSSGGMIATAPLPSELPMPISSLSKCAISVSPPTTLTRRDSFPIPISDPITGEEIKVDRAALFKSNPQAKDIINTVMSHIRENSSGHPDFKSYKNKDVTKSYNYIRSVVGVNNIQNLSEIRRVIGEELLL